MSLSAAAAGGQIRGDREDQEDRFALVELGQAPGNALLLFVADGMGGHAAGATAAEAAMQAFVAAMRAGKAPWRDGLRPALLAANAKIRAAASADPALDGMGCTLTAGLIADGALSWISVGDSALLLQRDGKVRRINADHSMRAILREMADAGKITHAAAESDPHRSALRSAVTGETIDLIDDPGTLLPLKAGDRVIAISDGMETLTFDEIAAIAARSSAPQAAVEQLLAAVSDRDRAGQDNATVALYCHAGDAVRGTAPAGRAVAALVLALALAASAAGYFLFLAPHKPATVATQSHNPKPNPTSTPAGKKP